MFNNNFSLGEKLVIGMIHLAGTDKIKRAIEEVSIYERLGLSGAMVENYYGSINDVVNTLRVLYNTKPKINIGVNILPNEFSLAFEFAHNFEANFIQIDYVSGSYYENKQLDASKYAECKEAYPEIVVLGGVWPKYYTPVADSDLEADLLLGASRAEAVVVTGEGTGIETPINKIKKFREVIKTHPLIVGAGLNPKNAFEQLSVADGAIVGSYFKQDNDCHNPLSETKVSELISVVKSLEQRF